MQDLLESGNEYEPPGWRRRAALGACLLVALGVGSVAAVEHREEAAKAEVVDLALVGEVRAKGSYDLGRGAAALEVQLEVRNDGPRPVTVLSGGLGDYGLAHETELGPGSTARLLLAQLAGCTGIPPQAPALGTVALAVRAEAGVRRVQLPMPEPYVDRTRVRACGYASLPDSVAMDVVDVEQRARSLRLRVDVASTAWQPVDLVGAHAAGDGFAATVEQLDGGPLRLPPADRGRTTLLVDLWVSDCAKARSAQPLGLVLTVEDERRDERLPQEDVDPSLRAALVSAVCPDTGSRAS